VPVPTPLAITAEEFTTRFGVPPILDDLDRVNCPDAGYVGHWQCRVCSCGRPRFLCGHVVARLRVDEEGYEAAVKSLAPRKE
jgi:hypothetical protein